MSNFHALEVVGRGYETQLQVGIISTDDNDRDQIVQKRSLINPYNAEIVLFEIWGPNIFFNLRSS